MPFVYILRCNDGSYYVGQTKDLRLRLDEHLRLAAGRPFQIRFRGVFPFETEFVSRAGWGL